MKLPCRSQKPSLHVVITGGSRGLGRAMMFEHVRKGDNVTVVSRHPPIDIPSCVDFHACDLRDVSQLEHTISRITRPIDMWINNAAVSDQSKKFHDLEQKDIREMIAVNQLTPMVSLKLLRPIADTQPSGMSFFNISGAGSDGRATPLFVMYGATKAAISQWTKSLMTETSIEDAMDIHFVSPGLMETDLLLTNMDPDLMKMLRVFTTDPLIVASHLVPRMRRAYYKGRSSNIVFQTPLKIAGKLLTQFV